jgi:uncharacterized membrane protein
MKTETPDIRQLGRIPLIDVARGLALVAMAVYHFFWDLQFFGFLEPGTATDGPLKWFARSIATSFLALVGIGLYLGHGAEIRWRPFLRRVAIVGSAALLITLATYVVTPASFVSFGILHLIAVGSFLGLAVLPLPVPVILTLSAGIFAAGMNFTLPALNTPLLSWIGMSETIRPSNDFVPVFPWFSAVLVGIAMAKQAHASGLLARLVSVSAASPPARFLKFFGRHSLAFYLVHQPVLIAIVAGFAQLLPPSPAIPSHGAFLEQCEAGCAGLRNGETCASYCACFLGELETAGEFATLASNPESLRSSGRIEAIAALCTSRADAPQGATP